MKYRDVYIMKGEGVNDKQAKSEEIDISDPISAIIVKYVGKNGTTHNQQHPLHDYVSAIEVLDGSDVITSLSMIQAQALNFYEMKRFPASWITEYPYSTTYDYNPFETTIIHYGRHLWDNELFLDPTKFRNPKIKLTHDFSAIASSAAADEYETDEFYVDVIARVIEEGAGTPLGFLMSKEHHSWTTVASGEQPIVLPSDYPYRAMLFRAYEKGIPLTTNITNLKMTIDEDKYVPFDLEPDELLDMNESMFGLVEIQQSLHCSHAEYWWMCFMDHPKMISATNTGGGIAQPLSFDTNNSNINMFGGNDGTGNMTSDTRVHVNVTGRGVHSTVLYPFGLMSDPATWLQAQEFGKIKLKATQGDAGAAASVLLQQLRSYV